MGKMKVEVLNLKCNQYRLISIGKKSKIIKRLIAHLSDQSQSIPSGSTTNSNINIISSATQNANSAIEEPNNEVNHAYNNDTNIAVNDNIVLAELQALQSEIYSMKITQQQIINQNNPPVVTLEQLIRNHNGVPTIQASTNGNQRSGENAGLVQLPHTEVARSTNIQGMNLNFTSNSNLNSDDNASCNYRNLFIPPPLKTWLLKSIKKFEDVDFEDVDFEDLAPRQSSTNIQEVGFGADREKVHPSC